jgi:mannose-6-phosphate isomerase-like protein (cupin superfamily)
MPNRRDLLKIAAAFQTLAAAAPAAGKIPSSTMDRSQATLTREDFGDLRVYFDGRTDQLGAMTFGSLQLKPGMSPHPPHQHAEEEIMVVTEGSGEISVEGKVTKVAAGATMYCAGNKVHGIVNTGKTPLLFYYFKWKS